MSSALTVFLAAGTAVAQQDSSDEEQPDAGLEQVTVTGTRIVRDGYSSPTPISVLGSEALRNMPVPQIGEAVDRLPVFAGSQDSRNNSSISDGTAGTNLLNLRGLGSNRTLVLLDGKRVVGAALGSGSNLGGAVDISTFPTGLVERVEVVTGGASAVYGSDAVAGVVNFILDKDYTGFKTRLQGGTTTHGDGEMFLASMTAGLPFAEGRGHFLFSAEHAYDAGIQGKPRDWTDNPYALIRNPDYAPDNGQPFYLTLDKVALSVGTRGGLILDCATAGGAACPLRGIMFGRNGQPLDFEFGPLVSGVWMQGGDWQVSRIDRETGLALQQERDNLFTRFSYDVTDSTTAYAEVLWGRAKSTNPATALPFNLGDIIIKSGNPFIPAPVQAQMTALGIPSFRMGSVNEDADNARFYGVRELTRFVVGLNGGFEAVGTDWGWDASFVTNETDILMTTPNNKISPRYFKAVDAVVSNGRIVCSVNADADPSNDDPACVPYNNMGLGVLTEEAHDYAFGTGHATTLLEQTVAAASIEGEPFDTWAGPVSLAFGGAYRTEEVSGTASELDQQNAFLGGNYHPSFGEYDVTEAFIETVVPLAADLPLAEQLDFNGAVRWTDYSTSGQVTTWKVGASWRPIEDLRFRVTRSRDIRAPSLGNLYNGGSAGTGTTFDPFLNEETQTIVQNLGNPELLPEEADTTGIGFVYEPSWFDGFTMSVDYYDIEINGAIETLGTQEIVDRCFNGVTILCDNIIRDPTIAAVDDIDFVISQPENILAQKAAGYDIEASYTFPLSDLFGNLDGTMSLRALVTYVDKLDTIDVNTVVHGAGQTAGSRGGPGYGLQAAEIRYLSWATYSNGPLSVTLTMRGIGDSVYSNSYIVCEPGSCPTSTPEHPTINNNHIDAVRYFDLGFNYMVPDTGLTVFFNAQNVLDTDPPRVATTSFWQGTAGGQFYDRIGRVVRAGVLYEF